MAIQERDRNPNWRGGRSVASNGYVLIRVGTHHHLADVRGYAYEHRLVAEEMLGRRMRPQEVVHHVDGDKQNNLPKNLRVFGNRAHHFVTHRGPNNNCQLPNEPNVTIACACGCGRTFPQYDRYGRPRKFVSGHNSNKR